MYQQPMYQDPMYGAPNNGFGGYPQPQQYAMYQPRPQSKGYQPLSSEQIKELRQRTDSIDWRVSNQDLQRAICTHKENGQLTLSDVGGGYYKCSICGEKFRINNPSREHVAESVDEVLNILQNIKTIYGDIPPALAENFFQIIPLLKKVPAMYDVAYQNFESYDNPKTPQNGVYMGYAQQPNNAFNIIGQVMSNPFNNSYMGAGYYQQPPVGYQPNPMAPAQGMPQQNPFVAAPMAYQQPVPMAPMTPMAYQMAPDAGHVPMMGNMAYGQPQMAQQQAVPQQAPMMAPQANVADSSDTVRQTKSFQA